MAKSKKTTLYVRGMHCPSCEILISDKLKEIQNVKEVKADHKSREVEVRYTGSFGPKEIDSINNKIKNFGYEVVGKKEVNKDEKEPLSKRLFDAGAIAIIIFILFYIAQDLKLIPSFNTSSNLTFATVFILGIVASLSTCMATSGALFLATVGKLSGPVPSFPPASARSDVPLRAVGSPSTRATRQLTNIIPAFSFNFGRIISYGFFGFIAGLIGKTLIGNFQISSILTMLISFFMIIIGLDMAKIISLQGLFTQNLTSGIFQKLESRLIKNPKKTAFFLGAITYLLPCGFTQTVQLYALGLANPWQSAAVMMVFALGTTPMLMAIGYASSFTKSSYFPMFQKVMGTLVFLIGIYYLNNFLGIYGLSPISSARNGTNILGSNVVTNKDVQVASMDVNSTGYSPNVFTVKKGVPVRWVINGNNVFGCQGYLVSPKLGIQKVLAKGQNVIEFTPKDEGPINFSCAMGMFRGVFNVVGG